MTSVYHTQQLPLFIEHLTEDCTCSGKICTQCSYLLCIQAFSRHAGGKDALRPSCKTCNAVYNKEYRKAHNKHRCEYNQQYLMQHPEKTPQYHRNYTEKHPGRKRQSSKTYYDSHHDQRCLETINRKAKRLGITGVITIEQWLEVKAFYDYACLRCRRREPDIRLTVDHVIPFDKRGPNAVSNIQPLCLTCNKKKHTKIIDYRPLYEQERRKQA